jgi:hypothetical protein
MNPVDNHSIADAAEIIFANSSAYVVELPMVGREDETKILLDALMDAGNPRAISLTAPLGAGKTFFLGTVFGEFSRSNPDFDERRDRKEVLATDLLTPDEFGLDVTPDVDDERLREVLDLEALFDDNDGRKVLVIEELDRKATLAQVRWCAAAGAAWLNRSPDRVLVVSGDATINGRHIAEFLRNVARRDHIALGPLDLELLHLALYARILEKLLKPVNPSGDIEELERLAQKAATEILADNYIRWSAVPSTVPPMLATFREALGVLRGYAQSAPSHKGSVLFDRELVELIPAFHSGLSNRASALEAALGSRVEEDLSKDLSLQAYTTDELSDLIGAQGGPEFEKRVVRLLVRKSLLSPIGIPYEAEFGDDREPTAMAGPYIPSYRLVHNTLLRMLHG